MSRPRSIRTATRRERRRTAWTKAKPDMDSLSVRGRRRLRVASRFRPPRMYQQRPGRYDCAASALGCEP